MKTIDNLTRQRVFALYWRQPIARLRNDHDNQVGQVCNVNTRYCEQFVLEVTPLSAITDEDAIEVAKILKWRPNDSAERHELDNCVSKFDVTWLKNKHCDKCQMPLEVTDFLRSRGYALPAYGYSVDELVSAGIFKIKTQ